MPGLGRRMSLIGRARCPLLQKVRVGRALLTILCHFELMPQLGLWPHPVKLLGHGLWTLFYMV